MLLLNSPKEYLESQPILGKNTPTNRNEVTESFEICVDSNKVKRICSINDAKSITELSIPKDVDISKYETDLPAFFDWIFLRSSQKIQPASTDEIIRCADLFSGCGGLSLGIREACVAIGKNFKPVLAVDSEINSLNIYINNFAPKQAFCEDIEKLLSGKLGSATHTNERELIKGNKNIDFLIAGPPCQGHSNLNNHTRRDDERNKLYEKVARYAEIAEPTHILIENVPTIVNSRDGSFQRTLEFLEKKGYKCDQGIVNLADFGVAQRRMRHILVASMTKNVESGHFISEIVKKHQRNSQFRTLRWAIEDLEQEKKDLFNSCPPQLSQENLRRISYLFENDLYDLPNSERPICHQNDEHSYNAMYGRLYYDVPTQTITSGFGSPGQGRYIHPTRQRTITPHEAARIQFFPDWFDFSTIIHRKHLSKMIGNAVPMKLSYIFGLEFLS